MNKLQEIKEKFENKTVGGYDVELLSYKEGQHYCIIGTALLRGEWVAHTWTLDGHISAHPSSSKFSLIPKKKKHLTKDILCEVWDNNARRGHAREREYSTGSGEFFYNGRTSATEDGSCTWDNFKVLEQDPQPWFNDKPCPIPEGLKYKVFHNEIWVSSETNECGWINEFTPITAYQILGEK